MGNVNSTYDFTKEYSISQETDLNNYDSATILTNTTNIK